MKIFIRVDGGRRIGMGHIMRMIVLAKELEQDNDIFFLCKDNEEYISGREKIKSEGFSVLKIREYNCNECIIILQHKFNADVLITDSYDVDEKYFDIMRKHFTFTGYVDDLNKQRLNVDFIINQNIYSEELKYEVSNKTKLFLGTKFCMMREEFRKAYIDKEINDNVNDVMITVGGMDSTGLSVNIINMLKSYDIRFHVVIGSAFSIKVKTELRQISAKCENVILYENAIMSKIMKKCDVAISACGSTLYELSAMNVPTIGIIVADNQEQSALNMKKGGAVYDVVHVNEINKITSLIDNLINNYKLRKNIVENQKNIVNIDGAKLLADNINKLIESRCI